MNGGLYIMKSKKKRTKLWYILTTIEIIATIVLVVSLGVLAYYQADYKKGEDTYNETKTEFTAPAPMKLEAEIAPDEEGLQVDFEGLQAQNKEIIAWMDFPRLEMSYPILQAKDNDKYLHTMYTGEYNRSGSIFLDCNNSNQFSDAMTIMYGHNMNNGTMFAGILNYFDASYYRDTDRLYLYLPGLENPLVYRPYAVCNLAADDDFYFTRYQTGTQEYTDLQQRILSTASYLTGITPSPQEHILALSTCTKDGNSRIVMFLIQTAA